MSNNDVLKFEEGELVWAYRDMFKNESYDHYFLSEAADVMPYLIIKADNDIYYALLTTNKDKKMDLQYGNANSNIFELSEGIDKKRYVDLSAIYQLTKDDIIKVMARYNEATLEKVLTKLAASIINSDLFLSKKDFSIFKQIYKKYNNLDLGDIVTIKKDDHIKNYIIINKPDSHRATGVSCEIIPNKKTGLKDILVDFTDYNKFNSNSPLYYKLEHGLSSKELARVLELKEQYYQRLKYDRKDAHYDMGVVVKINGCDYIVIADDDKNYYVTNYQDRHLFNYLQVFDKHQFKFQYVSCIDDSELLSILIRIAHDKRNPYPDVMGKVTDKVKRLLIAEKKELN